VKQREAAQYSNDGRERSIENSKKQNEAAGADVGEVNCLAASGGKEMNQHAYIRPDEMSARHLD
jgi:hypothetical protein